MVCHSGKDAQLSEHFSKSPSKSRINKEKSITSKKTNEPLEKRQGMRLVYFTLFVCLCFNVPSAAWSFRDGTPIYCPLRRT